MADIQVRNLTKKFGDFTAVNGLNFSVDHGEIFGLLGPNGAGKSTLLRMLTTLVPPTSGSAVIGGHDVVTASNEVRHMIGVIPQAMTSDQDLSADENMRFYAQLYGIPKEQARKSADELLEAVDLVAWRDKPLKMYSGGMRRRLEIARGLVHSPKIFFLDEPTTGLDPVSRTAVWEMLTRLKRTRDLTIILTTHYMDEADKLCDRIAIVDHGKLVALDSPLKLKASVPSKNVLEVSFSGLPAGLDAALKALPEVATITGVPPIYRISSNNGPVTLAAMMDAVKPLGVTVTSLSVQSTTLDDVFMHYTGRQLRDNLQAAAMYTPGTMLPPRN